MNKLQVTSLKKIKMVPAVIEYNHEEIKAVIDAARLQVKNEVVTLDSIKPTKKTMADINKLRKEIKSFAKETVAEATKSITDFKSKTKQLDVDLEESRTLLSDQVDKFEEEERERKMAVAMQAIEQTKNEIELNDKYIVMIEIKDSYLLAASNPTKVKKLIVEDFKRVKALQDAEQMKIDTVHMVIDAHNARLRFKFEFEYFERHINDETSLKELSEIVNAAVTKRLSDEEAELERIKLEQEAAIEVARLRAKQEAEEKAEYIRVQAEMEHQAELDRIELENKKAIAAVELERRLEQDKRDREAQDILDAEIEKNRLEQLKKDEEAAALIAEVIKETEKFVPVKNDKTVSRVQTVKLEIKGTKEQLSALKIYMAEYEIKYTKL